MRKHIVGNQAADKQDEQVARQDGKGHHRFIQQLRCQSAHPLLAVLQDILQQGDLVAEAPDFLDRPSDAVDVALQTPASDFFGGALADVLSEAQAEPLALDRKSVV